MPHQSPLPLLTAPPQLVMPQVIVQVTAAGLLSIQSNLLSPGVWGKITTMLLAAAQTSHAEEVKEAQQAGGEAPRIVVPNGVVLG